MSLFSDNYERCREIVTARNEKFKGCRHVDRDEFERHREKGWLRADNAKAALLCLVSLDGEDKVVIPIEKYEKEPNELLEFIYWSEEDKLWVFDEHKAKD